MTPVRAVFGDTGREMGTPKIEEIVSALEDDIVFGRLKPREHLTEDDLIGRFGIKRHMVRQALIELERKGIVVREPYRGTRVRDFSLREIEQIYDFREKLHRWAAELMPLPADPALVQRLKDLHRHHGKAVRDGNLREINQIDHEFHKALFEACGNQFLTQTISRMLWLSAAMRSYPLADSELRAVTRKEHAEIIDALIAADRQKLIKLSAGHLRHSKKAYTDAIRFMHAGTEGR
ncbi:MAG: GntR family transcriptional regulator [Firmicutes bacterium]|nr:GntR family transcriptional regulator [Bacillota bacterium]